ncbi:hypothetical protein Tco_1534253, partial [Tanacetum coccineum]
TRSTRSPPPRVATRLSITTTHLPPPRCQPTETTTVITIIISSSSSSRYHHPHLYPVTVAAAQPKEGAVGYVISITPRGALALWQPPPRACLVVSRSHKGALGLFMHQGVHWFDYGTPRVRSVWYMHRPGCVCFLAAPPRVRLGDLSNKRVRVGLGLHRKGAVGFDLDTTRVHLVGQPPP